MIKLEKDDEKRGQTRNLDALLNVRDFGLQKEVVKIFESKIYSDNTELITDLEIYKFMSRDEILKHLKFEFPELIFENVKSVNRKEEFLTIEGRYGILLDHIDSKSVKVITRLYFAGTFPKIISLNWFIPALVNINVGSSLITIGAEGTIW